MSPNGVLGTVQNPLRCVVAQPVLMCIASWSLIAIVAEYGEVADVWAGVIHGIISSAALVYACICNYSGIVKGNTVSNGCHRMMWMLFAADCVHLVHRGGWRQCGRCLVLLFLLLLHRAE